MNPAPPAPLKNTPQREAYGVKRLSRGPHCTSPRQIPIKGNGRANSAPDSSRVSRSIAPNASPPKRLSTRISGRAERQPQDNRAGRFSIDQCASAAAIAVPDCGLRRISKVARLMRMQTPRIQKLSA